MAKLKRSDWYDFTRDTNWTPKYVSEEELFPQQMCGMTDAMDDWNSYDEPYKQTYTDYVKVQREKDAGAYSVRAVLERSKMWDNAPAPWRSVLIQHYGAIPLAEYAACTAEAHMTRFSKAPGMRNMATFGCLDEMRHGQMQAYFGHEHVSKTRQADWGWKAYHTNEWASIASRHFFDDMMTTRSAVETAIGLTFAFETGFTNLQFLALAAEAGDAGDHTFASLISSVQTDEARHAQIGGPLIRHMVEAGETERAQKMLDIGLWRAWKLFGTLTGASMDYMAPVELRKHSFKEFMEEWIVGQFERQIIDVGLQKPWYWEHWMKDIGEWQHSVQIGLWFWRPTVWWDHAAGMGPAERDWLEEKYPGWNDKWGKVWDVIIRNVAAGEIEEKVMPKTLPMVCNMCQIPIASGNPGGEWSVKDYQLEQDGRLYHFCSEQCRWVFEQEPARYQGHLDLNDRFLAGEIQPPTLEGALQYMGLAPGEIGDDAERYEWIKKFTRQEKVA